MRSVLSFAKQAFSGLRVRLLLMMTLVCAPLIAMMVHGTGEERRRALSAWQGLIGDIAENSANQEKDLINSTRQLLLALSVNAEVQKLDPAGAKASLTEIYRSYTRYANLGLLTTNGAVLASVFPPRASGFREFNFFRRTLERGTYTVGNAILSGRLSPRIYFGYPVRNADSTIAGIVYAVMDLNAYCRASGIPRKLPPDTTWTEVDRRGRILGLYPLAGPNGHQRQAHRRSLNVGTVGEKLREAWLLTNELDHAGATLEGADRHGVLTVYTWTGRRSRFVPGEIRGILAIPRATLFAEADQALSRDLSAVGIAAVLALLLGWVGSTFLILRPVRALVRSSARLARGDLSVRTGLKPSRDELGQLTQAFDQMAQSLETRELEHKRASHKLQVLSQRLVEVQEAERRHIARELHDEIGQSLTAAEMNLQAALRAPPATALQLRLEESIKAVERVLEQVHDLSLNLRPSMLDDLGLEPALRWYVQRQATLTGMRAEFTAVPLEERLDPLIETECFRVAQEALTNVVRHAHASSVHVELTRSDNHLHLSVRDDGIGFDVDAQHDEAVRGASLGLLSMQERTSLAGGGLEFTSAPGGGTEVHAWFPLKLRSGETQAEVQLNE